MKYRESGMPSEDLWNSFFDPVQVLEMMEVNNTINTLLDIGCGYGTFLIPASRIVKKVIGIDIDDQMINICKTKIEEYDFKNVELIPGDISRPEITRIINSYSKQIDYITLFNILHGENPVQLLQSAFTLLERGGKIGVIHWKYENTPRGPSMEIRPKPEQVIEWSTSAGLIVSKQIDLPPYHYGIILIK